MVKTAQTMTTKAPYAVILETDPGSALSLSHMFRAICQLSAEVFTSTERAMELLTGCDQPKVVVVGRVARRQELIQNLAENSLAFIVVIDRQEEPAEAEDAFLAGAAEVVPHPVSLRVLALRLRARIGMLSDEAGLKILKSKAQWESGAYIAKEADLTLAEAQIAHVLFSHNGEIVSRDALSYAIDHRPWDYGDRKFDVHVAKIRKKLNAVFGDHAEVSTIRSEGYRLEVDSTVISQILR